ncbi:MAG TPA: TIGR04255 family protein [Terriglobales bacterium]|jgi:uncharacterized protein (TIGR04255 family)
MVKRDTPLPIKLKNDAIAEALLEIRFETKTISELFLGRVMDRPEWKNFVPRQLPGYAIPPQIRLFDPNMRYVPVMELAGHDAKFLVRIGPQVISCHNRAPYFGWSKFKLELDKVVETLFGTTQDLNVTRLGLRYMNALRPSVHKIRSIADLDINLAVSGDAILDSVNLNFKGKLTSDSSCTVRIATKDLVVGNLTGVIPEDMTVYVDVDVFTNETFVTRDLKAVKDWIEFAHTEEKHEFFRLFKQQSIDEMREV